MNKKTIAIVATVISLITGIISILTFLTGKDSLVDSSNRFEGKDLYKSPWMGVELFQDSDRVDMVLEDDTTVDGHIIHIALKSEPFEIRIPDPGDSTEFSLAASYSVSHFSALKRNMSVEEIPFLRTGTTFAAYNFAEPTILVSQAGHSYYSKHGYNRLHQRNDGTLALPVTSVWNVDNEDSEHHIRTHDADLYLILVMDQNKDRILGHTEYEFFHLSFN